MTPDRVKKDTLFKVVHRIINEHFMHKNKSNTNKKSK